MFLFDFEKLLSVYFEINLSKRRRSDISLLKQFTVIPKFAIHKRTKISIHFSRFLTKYPVFHSFSDWK